ncbi:probable salivary secreted peptide [Solenopsis invicta]|uniref:probable salivary secreted peptide n=1 Tax=Solenopsis invicta TaxID=13686 RepID=UPI0001FE9245|nr:probable salivary secreted peptide [Solenopsis invicta]
MSAHKYIIGLTVLVATLLTVNSVPTGEFKVVGFAAYDDKSHHMIVGAREAGDRLAYQENIVKTSSWLQIVKIEKTFSVPSNERITLVEALDQKTNGNGAYASILSGGPGSNSVTIKFKSQRSHGINFDLRIYSRRY